MATGPWDAFRPTRPEESQGPWSQFATPAPTAKGPWSEFKQEEPVGESGGFFDPAAAALRQTVKSYLPAAKLFTGLGDQKAATEELLKGREEAGKAYKQTEFSEIGDAFKKGNIGEAVGKLVDKTKEVAGSSLGAMGPAIAAGQAGTMLGGPVVGMVAFGVTGFGSYLADYIGRQKEERKKEGREGEDIDRVPATLAAAGSTVLDLVGGKIFKPIGQLMGIEGRQTAERAAMEIVEAATKPGAYRRAVAKGTAQGIAFEVPQEVTQQVLERWQAGLALNPFDDPEAAREYAEAAGGALLLGSPMGAFSKVKETRAARQSAEGQAILQKGVGTAYDTLSKGAEDVTEPTGGAGGEGTTVAGQPGAVTAPGGIGAPLTTGVVSPRQPATTPTEGEISEPGALAPSEVDKWAARAEGALGTTAVSAKYGTLDGVPAATGAPAAPEITPERINDFRRQYEELRTEALSLMGKGVSTPEQTRQLQTIQKNLNEVVNANADLIGDRELVRQLKNPVFDGTPVLDSLTRAPAGAAPTQMGLVPGAQPVNRLVSFAMAATGKDPRAAVEYLQQYKDRQRQRYANGEFDANWAMTIGPQFGLSRGEASENPEAVAQRYLSEIDARVDQAIADLSKQFKGPVGAPRKKPTSQQPDLFAPKEATDEEVDRLMGALERKPAAEEFGAPIPGEKIEEQATPEAAQPAVQPTPAEKAPEMDTEHIRGTEEGKTITQFFDAVKPASESPGETAKHQALRDNAIDALVQYDIAKPGETTSPALRLTQELLSRAFGGMEQLRQLLGRLPALSAGEQSILFKRAGIPDLTTRRGLEQFYHDLQVELEQMSAPEDGGVKVPTRTAPAVTLPITKATLPYTEEFTTQRGEFRRHEGTQPGGKLPRKSEILYTEIKRVLSDLKIRKAMQVLRQKIEARVGLTKEDLAAKTYFDNPYRTKASEALNALAYDLAMYEINRKVYGANSTFMGEGGEYASRFYEWVKNNLDAKTVGLVNELVEEHKQNAKAFEKYDESVTEWNAQREKLAAERRQQAEKETGGRLPKAPKRRVIETKLTEAVGETPAGEEEVTPDLPVHRPRLRGIYEIHPDMRAALNAGNTTRALEIMAAADGDPYYSALAKRLLEAGITAKTSFIDQSVIEPLNPYKLENMQTLNRMVGSMKYMARALPDAAMAAQIEANLTANDRDSLIRGVMQLGEQPDLSESEKATIQAAAEFIIEEFGWDAKYDPNTDTMIFRRGSGLSNHMFLHEALHAATYNLIDDPDSLTGIQRQGYDQLVELYNYAAGAMANRKLLPNEKYGLKDLHEFVSEVMTNPHFQALMRDLRYKASPFSLYTWFTRSMRKLFRIDDNADERTVFEEALLATDALMAGGITGKADLAAAKAPAGSAPRNFPAGRPNTPSAIKQLMTSRSWNDVRKRWPTFYASLKADLRPGALGFLTLRQIADLVARRIPQVDNFIRVAEDFLARKNEILTESGDIAKRWERLQARNPALSRQLAELMHRATIKEIDPDPASKLSTLAQRQKDPQLLQMWKDLTDPEAKAIYRQVRDFYERRYSEYRNTLNKRMIAMRQFGVSDQTINDIRAEFEKARRKGPYFPLMRHGRFWYQVGTGAKREYYMFESLGELEAHLDANPRKDELTAQGDQYQQQMDHHARQSQFLKSAFEAIDKSNMADKQELKDSLYQSWLSNQPESSFRTQFMHRQRVAGYSEDALRNFAKSAFHMAYQMSRFEHAPEMFSQIAAARMQLKGRIDAADPANRKTIRENNELSDYVKEMELRLGLMLNPTDIGTIPSTLSNIGFIWYLTAPASAITNVLGGMIIGLPTLIGQQVKLNPRMSYTRATLEALSQMKTVAAQIMRTGFEVESGDRVRDYALHFPSLSRSTEMSAVDQAAYRLFVADGLIDITATYDQSGLAAAPTESYTGLRHRTMQALSSLFHNAERFNREVIAMSAFRTAMEKRKGYADQQKAFEESIAEAKDVTNRSMFDYSSTNKPRHFQHPVARVVLQFKQFPQQMTFFLAQNLVNMLKGASPEVKREATARFVGTMGMAAIFSGATGIWGFSTVAAIVNAVINGLDDDRDEPFDFELEFVNWANETFGNGLGMFIARGAGNAVGVDLASRVKLDEMWFRDSRKNQDEVEALQAFLVEQLGPTVGLAINAAQAVKLWNEGHADRAIEMVSPAFIKQPLVAARYASEGANTLRGDPLMEDMGPFELLMQSIGLRPAELAERQYYNITKKGQEQAILKERQNLLNLYGISFMSGDVDANEKAFDKMMEFNEKHPSVAIPADSIIRSIKERVSKSAATDHGLYIDKRMRGLLDESYLDK